MRTTSVRELAAIWRHSAPGVAVMGGVPPSPAVTPKPEPVAETADAAAGGAAGGDAAATQEAGSRSADINAGRPGPGAWDSVGVTLAPGSAAELAYSRSRGGVGFFAALRLLMWRQSRTLSRNKPLIGA